MFSPFIQTIGCLYVVWHKTLELGSFGAFLRHCRKANLHKITQQNDIQFGYSNPLLYGTDL
jgi:hypothetical protein